MPNNVIKEEKKVFIKWIKGCYIILVIGAICIIALLLAMYLV